MSIQLDWFLIAKHWKKYSYHFLPWHWQKIDCGCTHHCLQANTNSMMFQLVNQHCIQKPSQIDPNSNGIVNLIAIVVEPNYNLILFCKVIFSITMNEFGVSSVCDETTINDVKKSVTPLVFKAACRNGWPRFVIDCIAFSQRLFLILEKRGVADLLKSSW